MNKTITTAVVVAAAGALVLVPVTQAYADHSPTTSITKVTINGGKPVVVGATETTKFSVVVMAKDSTSALSMDSTVDAYPGHGFSDGNNDGACEIVSGITWKCIETYSLKAGDTLASNATAGTWHLWYDVIANPNVDTLDDSEPAFKVIKSSLLTVNASPEPVKKGKTITVTGKLSRANWITKKYAGYGSQKVKLQFKKAGASSYVTVKTVKSSSTGTVKTTAKATADGTWRFVYSGSSTTAAVTSAGDYVDVR